MNSTIISLLVSATLLVGAQTVVAEEEMVWGGNVPTAFSSEESRISIASVFSTYSLGAYEGEFRVTGTTTIALPIVYGVELYDKATGKLVDTLSLGEETLFGVVDGPRSFRYAIPSFVIGKVEAKLVMYIKDGKKISQYVLGSQDVKGDGRVVICSEQPLTCRTKEETDISVYLLKDFPFATTSDIVTRRMVQGESIRIMPLLGEIPPGKYYLVIEKEGGIEKKIVPYEERGDYASLISTEMVTIGKDLSKLIVTLSTTLTDHDVKATFRSSYGDTCVVLLEKKSPGVYEKDIPHVPCERGELRVDVLSLGGAEYDSSTYLFDVNTYEYDNETGAPNPGWFITEEKKEILSYTVLILILLSLVHLSVWRGKRLKAKRG